MPSSGVGSGRGVFVGTAVKRGVGVAGGGAVTVAVAAAVAVWVGVAVGMGVLVVVAVWVGVWVLVRVGGTWAKTAVLPAFVATGVSNGSDTGCGRCHTAPIMNSNSTINMSASVPLL